LLVQKVKYWRSCWYKRTNTDADWQSGRGHDETQTRDRYQSTFFTGTKVQILTHFFGRESAGGDEEPFYKYRCKKDRDKEKRDTDTDCGRGRESERERDGEREEEREGERERRGGDPMSMSFLTSGQSGWSSKGDEFGPDGVEGGSGQGRMSEGTRDCKRDRQWVSICYTCSYREREGEGEGEGAGEGEGEGEGWRARESERERERREVEGGGEKYTWMGMGGARRIER
jgi:hypothetical protein